MIEGDFRLNDMIASRDPGLSLSIMQLVRDLRTLARSIQAKLDELEKEPLRNEELILEERAVLEATRKEIDKLERKAADEKVGLWRDGKVFKKEGEVGWKCNNCGYVYKGQKAPDKCPACDHPQDYFQVKETNY